MRIQVRNTARFKKVNAYFFFDTWKAFLMTMLLLGDSELAGAIFPGRIKIIF